MLLCIIGENCSGKSTLANEIKKSIDAQVVTGKDYLRMAKSESEARIHSRILSGLYGLTKEECFIPR